ncbi:MAG: threonylcarbamoyl-AMP synthase [Deltaproteobacteria bacterium]|nr:MAG: threonylcarbamoyl-AMP synthase [Deltaproteobacteria bacterium]
MAILRGDDPEAIRRAAEVIRRGGVVAFPTETVYGLGADAFNARAVALIFELKGRPRFDPLIVHVADPGDVKRLWQEVDSRARKLMERFWPGPLTLVLPKRAEVPDIVTAGLGTVAVRMPAHPVALALIREAETPVAAPSANPFGRLSPTTAEHVLQGLGERVEVILDGGRCPVGVESTVLALDGEPRLLRPGGVPVEQIEEVIGPVKKDLRPTRPEAPGGLPRHYSPRTPLRLLQRGEEIPRGLKVGLLAFKTPREGFVRVEVLSPSGDLREAAARLFEALHRLDSAGLDLILAESVPEEGLGLAIMDRLRRASQAVDKSQRRER